MNKVNTLVILAGALEGLSLPRLQLNVDSVFDLRIKGNRLWKDASILLPNPQSGTQFLKASNLSSNTSIGQLKAYLHFSNTTWRNFERIIFFPAHYFFEDLEEVQSFFKKLEITNETTRYNFGLGYIYCFQPGQIMTLSDDLLLSNCDWPEVQIHFKAHTINLSKPMGVFELSKIQTRGREFNQFLGNGLYIKKVVSNRHKGASEYQFLSEAPNAIKAFFPQVGQSEIIGNQFSYEIEFIPLFDLSRFFIHNGIDPMDLKQILESISTFFKLTNIKSVGLDEYKNLLTKLFIEKLRSRQEKFKTHTLYSQVDYLSLATTGINFHDLVDTLIEKLSIKISRIDHSTNIFLSHGDLCFSNILWDRLTNQIKFIDPRGNIDNMGTYMPMYYDLSKLSHSLIGGYDWIMNDMAEIRLLGKKRIDLHFPNQTMQISPLVKVFTSWVTDLGLDIELVRLGEASLFWSMLSLHVDQPEYVLKQFVAGYSAMNLKENYGN